ncbi:MAG: TonB-dependent receptor, partial [Calditrichaceae bacterium]
QYPDFEGWNSLSEALLNDDDPSNDLSPAAAQKVWQWERRRRPSIEPDYIIDGGLGGPFPFISESLGNLRFYSSLRYEKEMLLIPLSRDDYKDYSGTVKINSDISRDLKIQLTGTMGRNYDVVMNSTDRQFDDPSFGINGVQYWSPTNFIRTPYEIAEVTNEQRPSRIFTNSWYSQAKVDHLALAGKLTHYLNPTTFYDVSLEYINRDYTTGPIDERDYTKKYEVVPGYFVDEAPYGFSSQPNTGITGMFFGGHSSQIRDSSDISSYALNADITSQVTKEHLLKAGIQLYYYDLNLNYGTVREFFGDYNYVNDTWNPLRFSAYIQDKIEMLGFIANLGLRMDISDPNTSWADVGPFNKEYFSGSYSQDANIEMKEVNADVYLSPRLGISHPVTENSKIYFNYGHFKQMPPYEEIFRIGRSTNGSMQNYGDPTLDQAKTIAYQLGYDHSLFDAYLIQIAAFYNDISDQQDYTQYVDDRAGIGYYRANNDSYEDIRGLEITLRKNNGVWFRGFTNFTYQVSTQGGFGRPTITANPRDQQVLDQTTSLKYQQKPVPQPRGNVNLTFLTPFDYGPDILGLKPFSDWSINLLAEYRAGEHLTYNPNNVTGIQNNVQVTDYSNFDLRINKAFDFNSITIMLYMEFRNLFNQKRLSGAGFYDVYDQQFYFQ